MSNSKKLDQHSIILEAIRAKRERRSVMAEDIAALEASLLADIENFDLDAAERQAQRDSALGSVGGASNPQRGIQNAARTPAEAAPPPTKSIPVEPRPMPIPEAKAADGSLLAQLRQQAEMRQREIHSELAERSSLNESIDQALKNLFFYLHDLVQQLNILKPGIPRDYPLVEHHVLNRLAWQEGFADYRTQTQSAGALVELVSFSYRLSGGNALTIERDGPAVERFRAMLFDFGLPFSCKEFKNERRYVERCEFEIRNDISVTARWRADFGKGLIILETRNLERLGGAFYTVQPRALDQALLEDFARLVLGQPNHFRELAKRP